jgi:hypothetical protein
MEPDLVYLLSQVVATLGSGYGIAREIRKLRDDLKGQGEKLDAHGKRIDGLEVRVSVLERQP